MSDAICGQEAFYCDAIDMGQHECPICCTISTHKLGWVGVLCSNCHREFSLDDEEWRGTLAEKRRELLGLTRRQMGTLVGVAGSKIARYETRKCPDAYWEKTKELVVNRDDEISNA